MDAQTVLMSAFSNDKADIFVNVFFVFAGFFFVLFSLMVQKQENIMKNTEIVKTEPMNSLSIHSTISEHAHPDMASAEL